MKLLRLRAVRVVLDVVLLVGFIAEFATREGPDYAVHSWIGIVLTPIIAVHLLSNWRWVTSVVRRRNGHPDWSLALLNTVFSIMTAVCILTGFPIWLEWSTNNAWSVVHTITGFLSVILALTHLWWNRKRLGALLRRRASVSV